MPGDTAYRLSHPEFLRLSPSWPDERTLFDGLSGRTYLTGELGHEILRVLSEAGRPAEAAAIAERVDAGGGSDEEFVAAVAAALGEFERLGLVERAVP